MKISGKYFEVVQKLFPAISKTVINFENGKNIFQNVWKVSWKYLEVFWISINFAQNWDSSENNKKLFWKITLNNRHIFCDPNLRLWLFYVIGLWYIIMKFQINRANSLDVITKTMCIDVVPRLRYFLYQCLSSYNWKTFESVLFWTEY